MLPIHQKIAELGTKLKSPYQQLKPEEVNELRQNLDANMDLANKGLKKMDAMHKLMGETWSAIKSRDLSLDLHAQLSVCIDYCIGQAWEQIAYDNMFLIASMAGDHQWQKEILQQQKMFNKQREENK